MKEKNQTGKNSTHMNILLACTPSIAISRSCILSLAQTIHHILQPQIHIAHALESGTELECGRNDVLGIEQVTHLHHITEKPRAQNGEPESLAGPRALVGQDLRNGQEGFDGESGNAEEVDIGLRLGDEGEEHVYHEEDAGEIAKESPVSVLGGWLTFESKTGTRKKEADERSNILSFTPPTPEVIRPRESHE